MWLLQNETPFAAERTWVRDEEGVEHWLVAIKGSFDIRPDGEQVPSDVQPPVSRTPIFAGDPATTELLEETDFNLDKSRTDVLLVGHAHAPDSRPVTETTVRLKVENVDKQVRVLGERLFVEGAFSLTTTRPRPFQQIRTTWHRAYGGTDAQGRTPAWEPANPVGVGFARNPKHLDGRPAPNFEYAGADWLVPAGFGPVARHWASRLRYAGTYDDDWAARRDPLPPRDFDRLFHQCAPVDQQTRRPLVGYEEVRLGNFTADGFLGFLLPRVTFDVVTRFRGRPDRRQDVVIHTLWLRPDERRFTVIWHSALPCPYDEERLLETTVRVRDRINVPASVSRTGVWVP